MTYGTPATGKIKPGSHAWALNEDSTGPQWLETAMPLQEKQ